MRLFSLALAAALLAGPSAFADDKTGQHGGHGAHSGHGAHGAHGDAHAGHAGHAEKKGGVMTEATIHAVDGDTVNLTHPPIPEIGWPQMTMDLKLLEGANLGAAKPGDTVTIELEKGADGLYGIKSVATPE